MKHLRTLTSIILLISTISGLFAFRNDQRDWPGAYGPAGPRGTVVPTVRAATRQAVRTIAGWTA